MYDWSKNMMLLSLLIKWKTKWRLGSAQAFSRLRLFSSFPLIFHWLLLKLSFLISRCDKYSFIHTTSVEKLNFLSSTKWKQGRLKELAKLTAGYMISSGRRPLSYISMHDNAFKKAVAKKK